MSYSDEEIGMGKECDISVFTSHKSSELQIDLQFHKGHFLLNMSSVLRGYLFY